MNMEPTPEAKERIDSFIKEYGELVTKYKVDFANWPMFQPTKEGKWEITLQSQPVDIANQPVKCPFIEKAWVP